MAMQFPSNPKTLEEARQILQRIHKVLSSDGGEVVLKSLYDANTILKSDTDNTPVALAVPANTVVGRGAAGGIAALTMVELATLLALGITDISGLQDALDAKADGSGYDRLEMEVFF